MRFLFSLMLTVSCTGQHLKPESNRCDEPQTERFFTPCTSCAATSTMPCPPGSRKTTRDTGTADCRYTVDIGDRSILLSGCRHTCEKQVMEKKCCRNFWGPLCLSCPSWLSRVCNWHGVCMEGTSGNGTCVCEEGFTGFACHKCTNKNAYGEQCRAECNCVNGECNSGPDGDGGCYCQPPYTGSRCDHVSQSCSNCSAYSYCKESEVSSVCECLPGFRKVGATCAEDICSKSVCDRNAECTSQGARNYMCRCKEGYQGNGEVCTPVNPCDVDNGGCPANSTLCVYVSPGKSRCVCRTGMEGPSPSSGCALKSGCSNETCHRTAQCETGSDGLPICFCASHQIGDGRRCYGNILERALELDRDETLKGRITSSIAIFEKGCQLTLSQRGPFTAFIPVLTKTSEEISGSIFCKYHLILQQHLWKELQNNDYWLLAGEAIRFRNNKKFILMKSPDREFSLVQGDIPASNGIIHIIDSPLTLQYSSSQDDKRYATKTIGDILASEEKFNRFQSLLDNCGVTMPLRGPGPLTVFVPSNAAVDSARDGSFIYMLTDAKHKLQELLRHHMFSLAAITVDQLATMSEFQTMARQTITVNVSSDGKILLGEKGIVLDSVDIIASNGIIHVINGVFVPPSIVPILPHRCDVPESEIVVGPCIRCSHLHESGCPVGSTELESHLRDCVYLDPIQLITSTKGCAKYCNKTRVRAECCKGFFGADCKPCIGGFQNPCYNKGICMDGINGNGSCHCAPGFMGVACHICSEPRKHGENCDEDCRCVHGVCDNRPGSAGVCRRGSCKEEYFGDLCDHVLTLCHTDLFEHCHIHATCSYDQTSGRTECICVDGYEGDGHSCSPINPCLKPQRGGCDLNAQCIYGGPENASCVCHQGWTGDGLVCAEINNCLLEGRGGCHANADCMAIGPGQNECTCKKGYMGDGVVCTRINPCTINNGGCHALAWCKLQENGTHVCLCAEGLIGDGIVCYGNILQELVENSVFYTFYRWLQSSHSFSLEGNVTALVPTKGAFNNLTEDEQEFWFDPFRLPYLLKAHFLAGAFSSVDLKQHVNKELPTLNEKTNWRIKNISGEVMIENSTIVTADIPASNGYIHLIDTVLRPPVLAVPPLPPSFLEFLNSTPTFSLFFQATKFYNLTDKIQSMKYTVFIPSDEAIKKHLNRTNSTQLDEDTVKYHFIVNDQLFPDNFRNGLLKSTLLGSSYQIMFHTGVFNESLVNEVPLSGNFTETRNGVVMGIPQILEIHKNFCNKEVFLKYRGRCGACDATPKCSILSTLPIKKNFPPNMKSNCKYRKRVGAKRKSVPGCVIDCLRTTEDHSCCPGYFGHSCLKCPGKPGSWCSNNGRCRDGILGDGECLCNEGFHGTACETCEPGRYGKDCSSVCACNNGKCLDGLHGNGRCLCNKGWKGPACAEEIVADECGGVCSNFANCITGPQGTIPSCSCVAGYRGNGTFCEEINPCDTDNGGCSNFANCSKTLPGERTCTCQKDYTGDGLVCLEIDLCSENKGGCHEKAECVKTGPGQVGCNCMAGYSGNGRYCFPVNPCRKNNGDCHPNAWCEYTGPGSRNCSCRSRFIGDGLTCRGMINLEIMRLPDAFWFRRQLAISKITSLSGSGPFTVFVPLMDHVTNFTIEPWTNANHLSDLLRHHIVSCKQLLVSDLQTISTVVSLSGHLLVFRNQEGTVYVNEEAKIITSDYVTANGVIHFIDKVLIPYELKNKTGSSPTWNVTAVAEARGYSMFSRLLQDSSITSMLGNPLHQPFTMLWPTDQVFRSLPEERRKWLYSSDHRDTLTAYVKAHIVRDIKLMAVNLHTEESIRTMHGSTLSFRCDQKNIGDILVDNGNAKIVERDIEFDVGVAHGIDQLLEPLDLGARCDVFREVKLPGRCGSCGYVPQCSMGMKPFSNSISSCQYSNRWSRPYRYRSPFLNFPYSHNYNRFSLGLPGCRLECGMADWVKECCKNHYGENCQVCPGGLEAPCSDNGECDDRVGGTGTCKCRPGFTGTACELCAPGHYGSNCTICACLKGRCDDGPDGDGSCFCDEGWTGELCELQLGVKPNCTPECHPRAVCQPGNQCECEPPYEGDGWDCRAPDLCGENNGGCHEHADCVQTGINVTCTCLPGYTGDGYTCSSINRCQQEENGGCSDFATCLFTGPNERKCQCNPGYVGNGVQCLEVVVPPVDRCLEENGGCDPRASCKDLHFHENTAGVFHLRSPLGKYKLNYTDALEACQQEEASLATLAQVADAQQLGMHLCVAGWMEGAQVGYPIRFPSVKCGDNHVGIVLYKAPVDNSSRYDAYCYRMKDVSCQCSSEYVGDGYFCNGNLASVLATNANFSTFYSILLNYANASVEGENFLDFLSGRSTNIMLFVPHNSGFFGNETLSQRDVEQHISTQNITYLYEDLVHGAVILSHLGYNLTVALAPSTNTSLASQPNKLVNQRLIMNWDIPAINGIIHVIEGPLRAPPVVSPHSQVQPHYSPAWAILGVVAVVAVAAGVAYYFLKHKDRAFHFHYFRNEDEDEHSNDDRGGRKPALVSIPNPLYSSSSTPLEPFGVSEGPGEHNFS